MRNTRTERGPALGEARGGGDQNACVVGTRRSRSMPDVYGGSEFNREAGLKFLEENQLKDGVITLPSGLQYKVLSEGAGLEHPLPGTACECHYAGRLLDDHEFDSSYKRGAPTSFAPNQVIPSWTEAMQLMVEGDKWELYVPHELGYGEKGSPPKIPPSCALIFVIELVRIKGRETAPWKGSFPVWTAEEAALWLSKDEASCQSWRSGRLAKWEGGDEKLTAKYATREALEAWLNETCAGTRNKSLWKRTRTAKKKVQAEAAAAAAAAEKAEKAREAQAKKAAAVQIATVPDSTPTDGPTLNAESGRALLDRALAILKAPQRQERLLAAAKECERSIDPAMKMLKILPLVEEMLEPALAEHGFGPRSLMAAARQLQKLQEPSIQADAAKLLKAVTKGDMSGLF